MSLIIPAILFYSGLLETLKTLRNSWLTDEVLSSVLDNYNHFVPLVLPIFKDGGEFLTERRNIVERSLLDNSSHFVLFVLREIEDVAEFFTWKINEILSSVLENFSHFVLFVLVEIEDVENSNRSIRLVLNWRLCRMLDLQTKYCRAFLIISTILVYSFWLKLKAL